MVDGAVAGVVGKVVTLDDGTTWVVKVGIRNGGGEVKEDEET